MTAQVGPATPHRLVGERYGLLDILGRGGMGVVWRAEDRVIGRHVAVKELRLPDGTGAHEREVFQHRVLREARSAGRLNDPAIVTVYDVVNEAGATYIVMELVEAPTLSNLVTAHGPLPAAQVVSVAEQVLTALEAAHAAGIVHRDVKPSNIMVLPNGRVKLADFGIAQAADDPKLTTSGMLVGSPGYMAPERVHGAEATSASDLWALGAVLCYAAEGRSPFERATTAATLHAIMTETPHLTRVHGQLASVIMGLMVTDPLARLTGPQVHALLRLPGATGEPGTPPRPFGSPPYPPNAVSANHGHQYPSRTMPVARPRSGLRWVIAAGVAVLALGTGFAGYQLGHSAAVAAEPKPPAAMSTTLTYGAADAQLPQFELENGSCANGRVVPGRSFTSNESVDCGSPHDFEVFAYNVALDTSSLRVQAPAPRELAAEAENTCTVIFHSAVITRSDKDTTLNYAALVPSPLAWKVDPTKEGGTRRTICVLWSRDGGQLRHSVISGAS